MIWSLVNCNEAGAGFELRVSHHNMRATKRAHGPSCFGKPLDQVDDH